MLSKIRNSSNYINTPAGRVCRKEQGDNNAQKLLLYCYNPHQTSHGARRIYDPNSNELRQMLWDDNGNLAQQTVFYFVLYLLRDKLNKKFVFTIEE